MVLTNSYMSFKFCNPLPMFTTLMNLVFHDKLNKFVIIYIDDNVFMYSKITKEHTKHLKYVSRKFLKTIFLKIEQKLNSFKKIWTSSGTCCLKWKLVSTQEN
jgi:uncharacterized protein YlbG (UPF0298 family)